MMPTKFRMLLLPKAAGRGMRLARGAVWMARLSALWVRAAPGGAPAVPGDEHAAQCLRAAPDAAPSGAR